jgi:hypothetical protein
VLEPIPVAAFSLIGQQRSISGSPSGSPAAIETMLDFASRHNIAPQTEHFLMSNVNQAFARLESGKARYRIVLDADFWSVLEVNNHDRPMYLTDAATVTGDILYVDGGAHFGRW